MTWAVLTDIPARFRDRVTEEDLELAQTVVELFAGTTTESSDRGVISTRNLRLLRQAVVFQAIWAVGHPDLYTNMDVSSAGHDGLSLQPAHVDAQLLAPLSYRCIRRLSWKIAPLRVRKAGSSEQQDRGNRDSAAHDDRFMWRSAR